MVCALTVLDGVGAVLAGVDRAGPDPQVEIDIERQTATMSRAGVSHCGPSVFDLLRAEIAQRVVLETPDSPLLLVGFAGIAAQASGGSFELTADTGSVVRVSPRSWIGETSFAGVERIDAVPTSWSGVAAHPLPKGVVVDRSAWAQLLDLAQRTYVPASDESRISGAGAGLNDND